MQQVKQWFYGLETNEQKIVLFAAGFFSLLLLFFGLIKPLNDSVNRLQVQVDSRQSSVSKWQEAMPQLLASRGQAGQGKNNQPLSTLISSTTRRFNLKVSRVQEKKSEQIQVWFDNVSFKDFLRWSAELHGRHHLKIISVNIRSKQRDGLVSVDVKISKG